MHELAEDEETLAPLSQFRPDAGRPYDLLAWLESVVALQDRLSPDVKRIQLELGREAVLYRRAVRELEGLWARLANDPEVRLKRQLWDRLLRVAYGSEVDAPGLFLQHTYLVIVAKAVATAALMGRLPSSGTALLEGELFRGEGIVGAVEADFFDWLLRVPEGDALVLRIARQVSRFDLGSIEVDVLKGLYESLIDPATRHDLGEYYTPDWLAARVCAEAIDRPLDQRVIDPSCGSGTFLFHALRRLVKTASDTRMAAEEVVQLAEQNVAGIDVHPVAVIFARVTWLLALQPALAKGRPPSLAVPVYLGDALQWNARELMGVHELEVFVPPANPDEDPAVLRFPEAIVANPGLFDEVLGTMLDLAERGRPPSEVEGWLRAREIGSTEERAMLTRTYEALRDLHAEGRNHIWGYVARNLSRPIWLATERQKADVVIGNPPWLDYRRMSKETQTRFRKEMTAAGLWDKTVHGSAYDMSAYFFARAVHLYMRRSGHIAFVLPYAAMTRNAYERFRRGSFKVGGFTETVVQFTSAWAFPSEVEPLFPVPSSVWFARRAKLIHPLPRTVLSFRGHLRRRDASLLEAEQVLTAEEVPWPAPKQKSTEGSLYRAKFRAGAKLDPRRLVFVDVERPGRFGRSEQTPKVVGHAGSLDNAPWKDVTPPSGTVEKSFLRSIYRGADIAPYRVLSQSLGVVPHDPVKNDLMSSAQAGKRGYLHLARWLDSVETLWEQYGKGGRPFLDKINYYGQLTAQIPIAPLRVVYASSGSQPAALMIEDPVALIDYTAYWMPCSTHSEARYLCAILNSETARARAAQWQAEGQWGKRHFDKAMFNLPIPIFDPNVILHKELTAAALHAEHVAARVEIRAGEYFPRTRKRIRQTLMEEGVGSEIEILVEKLLGPA